MNKKILIAEDNPEISKVLKLYLNSAGYEVVSVDNGLSGLKKSKEIEFDLGIIDVMMPIMDGYELITKIRKFSNMPLLILSAKSEDSDKIQGLNIGADDYITKPFNPLEILARVNSSLRRYNRLNNNKSETSSTLILGELKLDTNTCKLLKNNEEITLTATEYKILKLFMERPNHIFSKIQISEYINGEYYENDDNVITVHISHIRDKIGINQNGHEFIKTVRGLGYKIENK